MLKFKVDNLDGLDEETKKLYKAEGNVFVLDIEGNESGDVAGLKLKVETLLTEQKAEKRKTEEADTARIKAEEEAATEKARKTGDIDALEASYKGKIATLDTQLSDERGLRAGDILKRAALQVASKLADGDNQDLLSGFIEKRLRVEEGEIKVTDLAGNLTISTLEQLAEEFRSDAKYSALVTGSKGDGGGAKDES